MSEDSSKLFSVYKKDGIIYCICPSHTIVDLETLKEGLKRRIELAEGKPHPILIDARDVKYWTLESRKFGLSKEAHQFVSAYVVLLNSAIIRTIVNWALKVFPITIPRRVFTNEEDAIRWLRQFVDKAEKPNKPLLVF